MRLSIRISFGEYVGNVKFYLNDSDQTAPQFYPRGVVAKWKFPCQCSSRSLSPVWIWPPRISGTAITLGRTASERPRSPGLRRRRRRPPVAGSAAASPPSSAPAHPTCSLPPPPAAAVAQLIRTHDYFRLMLCRGPVQRKLVLPQWTLIFLLPWLGKWRCN